MYDTGILLLASCSGLHVRTHATRVSLAPFFSTHAHIAAFSRKKTAKEAILIGCSARHSHASCYLSVQSVADASMASLLKQSKGKFSLVVRTKDLHT